MVKKILREKMKRILADLSNRAIKSKNRKIYDKVKSLPEFISSKTIFSYVSMDKEAGTKEIIDLALKQGKKVYVPKINEKKRIMNACEIKSLRELKKGFYDILAPVGRKCRLNAFDIILVPGLGFDRKMNRLGRGGGYFDKFFKKVKGLRIGICFKEQLYKAIPAQKHDIKMDLFITD